MFAHDVCWGLIPDSHSAKSQYIRTKWNINSVNPYTYIHKTPKHKNRIGNIFLNSSACEKVDLSDFNLTRVQLCEEEIAILLLVF